MPILKVEAGVTLGAGSGHRAAPRARPALDLELVSRDAARVRRRRPRHGHRRHRHARPNRGRRPARPVARWSADPARPRRGSTPSPSGPGSSPGRRSGRSPVGVPAATVYAMLACVAVQPTRLDGVSEAVKPAGTAVIDSRTRSKNVALRPTVIGRTPPWCLDLWRRRSRRLDAERTERPNARNVKQRLVHRVGVGRGLPIEVAEIAECLLHLGRRGLAGGLPCRGRRLR